MLHLPKVLSRYTLIQTIISFKGKYSVMELEGLGADIWKGIDAQEYVNEERGSWD